MGSMDTIISKEDPILQSPPPSSTSVHKSKIPLYTSSTTPNTARRKKETLLKEASSYCSKGCSEWKMKRSESAMEAFTSALLILESILGTFHLLTAKTYFWIGFILQKSSGGKSDEDYRRCLEAFSMAMRIRLRLCGSKHKSTEEARQAVRWAFRKISESNGASQESIQDFLLNIEKSLRYEVQGDRKTVAKDYPSALICFEKALQTAELWDQFARPAPQLMNKLGDCYASLGESQNAIFWYRRALLDIFTDAFYREKSPVVEMVYEQLKKLVPAESMKDYIQMVASSMQHVKSAQDTTGWTSQEEFLKAIQLELLYTDSKHPFVKFLLNKIDLNVIQEELAMQVQVADDGILQLALIFNRKDTDTSKKLEQLDAFQKRATSCLAIATEYIDGSVSSNHPLFEAWDGQEEKWLSRQVQATELLRLRVSDVHGKRVKKLTKKNSQRVDSLMQELSRLSNDLTRIQNTLNASPSKIQRGGRESLISQMADIQQEIAFREGQLELEQQSSEEESTSSEGSDGAFESLVALETCLREAKRDYDNIGPADESDVQVEDVTHVDKSSFWNDSFEAGLWKHPGESLREESRNTITKTSAPNKGSQHATLEVMQPLTINTESRKDHFDSFVSPKVMETTEHGASSPIKLENALREAEELRKQKERNNIELENAKSAMESCKRMLDQSSSAPGTEKSFLIQNLLEASRQEVDHFSRNNIDIDEKLHAVEIQIEDMQRQVQTSGEPSYATYQQGREAVKVEHTETPSLINSSERTREETEQNAIQKHSPAAIIKKVETQEGVLSHAPSVHKSLASAMQHLDSTMDRKLEKSFHGIDTFLLNPNAAASDLSSTMETVRKQALRRLDGCYEDIKTTNRGQPCSSVGEKTPPPSIRSEGVKVNKSKGISSPPTNGIVPIETMQKRIRRHKFIYYTPNGKFIMRRPTMDVEKWGKEGIPVRKEYNHANVVCPETIDVMVRIAYDGSTLLLSSSDSMVQHHHHRQQPSDNGEEWKSLGPIDQRDIPFGWIKYNSKGRGGRPSSYSLDEILEEAIVFRSRYCDSIVNPNLSLFDIRLYNGSIRIFVMLSIALVLAMIILKVEACVSPFLGR